MPSPACAVTAGLRADPDLPAARARAYSPPPDLGGETGSSHYIVNTAATTLWGRPRLYRLDPARLQQASTALCIVTAAALSNSVSKCSNAGRKEDGISTSCSRVGQVGQISVWELSPHQSVLVIQLQCSGNRWSNKPTKRSPPTSISQFMTLLLRPGGEMST